MWGRVPRDWEMSGIGRRAGCGLGGRKGGGVKGSVQAPRLEWLVRAGRGRRHCLGGGGGAALRSPPQPRAHEIFHSPPGPQPAPGGPHKAALCWEGGRAPGRPDTHAGRGGARASWHPNCLQGGLHPVRGRGSAGVNGAGAGGSGFRPIGTSGRDSGQWEGRRQDAWSLPPGARE